MIYKYDQTVNNSDLVRHSLEGEIKKLYHNDLTYCFIDFLNKLFTDELIYKIRAQFNYSSKGKVPFDPAFMLKAVLLQKFTGYSIKRMAQVAIKTDRLIQYALGIDTSRIDIDTPTFQTLWNYHEFFNENNVIKNLFKDSLNEFIDKLNDNTRLKDRLVIIDSSFQEVPIQRNTPEENEIIKAGKGDTLWNDNPHKKCHKDIDARHTKKGNKHFYGYKDNTKVSLGTKLILSCYTTSANVHDSQVVTQLFDKNDKDKTAGVFADSGYYHAEGLEKLQNEYHIYPLVIDRKFKNTELSDAQKHKNHILSKFRCRIEHVFGMIENVFSGNKSRRVGIKRAIYNTYLTSLTYNIMRFTQLIKYSPEIFKDPEWAKSFGY